MALCTSCSAPLPADSSCCSYCGTRNDLDVMALQNFAEGREESRRHCPDCSLPLETIRLSGNDSFAIERCPACFGLFFDPGEVQALLDASVAPTFEINYHAIVNINRERATTERPVRYIKCPECGKLMNRVNFGSTSGVVVDQCKSHGIWLDNGELVHLMEWKRAGGQLLAVQRASLRGEGGSKNSPPPGQPKGGEYPAPSGSDDDLLTSTVKLLTRIFG